MATFEVRTDVDEPSAFGLVSISQLVGGKSYSLSMDHLDTAGVTWSASCNVAADRAGRIEIDAGRSLFARLAPVGRESALSFVAGATDAMHGAGQPAGDLLGPVRYTLILRDGDRIIAQQSHDYGRVVTGVSVEQLKDGDMHGLVFRPGGTRQHRGVVLSIPGSGGGIDRMWAPALAAHGFDVVAPALFNFPGRPEHHDSLPLDYLIAVIAWARKNLGPKIAIQGSSRGAEAALLVGTVANRDVAAVVALSPFDCIFSGWRPDSGGNVSGWTWQGQPLPALPMLAGDAAATGTIVLEDGYRDLAVHADETVRIPIERIAAPVLLISGADDRMWPSAAGCERLMAQMQSLRSEADVAHLNLPDVGHSIMAPNATTALCRMIRHSVTGRLYATGGDPEATAAAARQVRTALTSFYDRAFGLHTK
jgi:dienelactone hydrolase